MKWEYRLIDFNLPVARDEFKLTEQTLNEYGNDGWEAVSTVMEDNMHCFVLLKRPRSK